MLAPRLDGNPMWRTLIVVLLLTCGIFGQEPVHTLRGSWIASADSGMVLRGTWTGQAHPDNPSAASGSWTLVNDRNAVVLQGTWAADRTGAGWRGRWSARTTTGQTFSGTWQAALADVKAGTVMEMLQRTLKQQVDGSWRYGRLAGHWWLQGSSP
jgi:hypothetical protein